MSLIARLLEETLRTLRGRRPRIATNAPDLAQLEHLASRSRTLIEPAYATYVARVSSPVWAVSLETACVLHALCMIARPRAILDLGSGFSSVTFRIYAKACATGCVIRSVDDNPQWLDRTRLFLESLDLSSEGLMEWSEFRREKSCYEVIFHDLGDMALRAESLEFILGLRAKPGWVILDDLHKENYTPFAETVCAAAGLRLLPLRDLTVDRYGRFAGLVTE